MSAPTHATTKSAGLPASDVVTMRKALDVLKNKWLEAEGSWAVLDFMEAGWEQDHWMRIVVEAERLSQPFVDAETQLESSDTDLPTP